MLAFASPTISANRSNEASLMPFTDFNSSNSFSAVFFPIPLMSANSECCLFRLSDEMPTFVHRYLYF